MTVITLERGRRSLRGRLTRWMLEVGPGLYVGTLSARVRDQLWDLILERLDDGAVVMVFSARSEQGFAVRSAGLPSRQVFDSDGLTLMLRPAKKK